jgi:hypothetical protein
MELSNYLKTVSFESTKNLITETQLSEIVSSFGIPIGSQLKNYLLSYGYLGKNEIEFYGVNSRQLFKSDLLSQTAYLHKYFVDTKPFYAIENLDDGEYALVNSSDDIILFDSENQTLSPAGIKLNDYFIRRFNGEVFTIQQTKPEDSCTMDRDITSFLPLGSVVLLQGATQKLLIIARAIQVRNGGKTFFFDYGGVLYPEGLTGDQMAYFNAENINRVVFEGYRDVDDDNMQDTIRAYLRANPDLERGSAEKWQA